MTTLNIVVPMAGRGNRFKAAGYDLPKPLLPIHGVPMIELVVNNLRPVRNHRFIFICLSEHIRRYDVGNLVHRIAPGCSLIEIDGVTEGAACSVLKAETLIDSDEPLMIANSDQYVDMDMNEYLDRGDNCHADGLIMTMIADDPKWSYAVLDANRKVQRVLEKQVVSNEATVGIYNFRRGADFVKGAGDMIKADLRVNNEFYVAPVYSQLIQRGKTIDVYNIGNAGERMFGLGVPEDLEFFRSQEISKRAAGCCQTRETA
jgi:NDP-sugar pyrophosphorylase family protein